MLGQRPLDSRGDLFGRPVLARECNHHLQEFLLMEAPSLPRADLPSIRGGRGMYAVDSHDVVGKPRHAGKNDRCTAAHPFERIPGVSHTAVIITVAYSIAVVLGAAIAFAIFRSTRGPSTRIAAALVAPRDGVARDHDRRPVRAPDGDDLLRSLRRHGRAERAVVRVTGVQFAWAIDAPQPIVTGRAGRVPRAVA